MKDKIEFNGNVESSINEDNERKQFFNMLFKQESFNSGIAGKLERLAVPVGDRVTESEHVDTIDDGSGNGDYLSDVEIATYLSLREKLKILRKHKRLDTEGKREKYVSYSSKLFFISMFGVILSWLTLGSDSALFMLTKTFFILSLILGGFAKLYTLFFHDKGSLTRRMFDHIEGLNGQKNFASVSSRKNLGEFFKMVERMLAVAKIHESNIPSLSSEIKGLKHALKGYSLSINDYKDENPRPNRTALYFSDYSVQNYIREAAYACANIVVKLEFRTDPVPEYSMDLNLKEQKDFTKVQSA